MNNTANPPTCHTDGCTNTLSWVDNRRYPDYCSTKCIANSTEVRKKAENTCIKKYGQDNYFKTNKFIDDVKKTNLECYGVEHHMQRDEVKEKIRNTNIERYGVDNPAKLPEIKKRAAKTNIERYGGISPMNSPDVIKKANETSMDRYGTIHPMQCDDVKNKCRESNIEKYGFAYSFEDDDVRKKAIDSIVKKYGKNTPYASKEVQEKIRNGFQSKYGKHPTQSHITDESLSILRSKKSLSSMCDDMTSNQIASELGVSHNTVVVYLRNHGLMAVQNSSTFEREVVEFIKLNNSNDILTNERCMIKPHELDVYIPECSLAFECNGSYWHSEKQGKDKHYHLNKTKLCDEKGIQLIHIWEHDWIKTPDLIKQRLLSKLGKNERVYARKTKIKEISTEQSSYFLNKHHIQGTCPASVKYGLFEQDELVAVMTFGKSRFSKKYEWELLRYCSTKQVIGGASKLFKHFQREHSPKTVISYSDKMWNTGAVYEKLGFEYSHTSSPAYYYTKNYIDFQNRVQFQKHKLVKKLEHFDPNITEWENMQANGYDRIWDCGNDVWVYKNTK
jgi:hypothetical protein